MTDQITIRGAKLHNLKNISLSIPKNQFVVLTGLSGSGKSTLGFDILNKEGQRQYIEALGLVPFGMSKPPVESITGLSPSISIDQHLTNHSPRSTVGTFTDLYSYLRVLFARLGHRPCPACGKDVPPSFDPDCTAYDAEGDVAGGSPDTFPCPHCKAPIPEIEMASFSFNKPEGACPTCTGLGTLNQANLKRLVDEEKSFLEGAVSGWPRQLVEYHSKTLLAAASHYGFELDLSLPIKSYSPVQCDLLFYGVESPRFRRHFPDVKPPTTVGKGRFEGVATNLLRRYAEHLNEHANEADYRDKLEDYLVSRVCPDCEGTRLRPESRVVTVNGKTIVELSSLSILDLAAWLQTLVLTSDEKLIIEALLLDMNACIARLLEVGAGYLNLDRASTSLSAGETQRLRLASLLGSGLSGVLYVFDEPTVGLHHRDTQRLIGVLRRLKDFGNTVLVIEHDLEVIAQADYVIDFGPGAGKHGGQVVAAGSPEEVAATLGSPTGDYLAGRRSIPRPERRTPTGAALTIHGACQHNLKDITVSIPLGVLVAVTGVSGSGKSTLVFDILDKALRQRLNGAAEAPGEHASLEGCQHIDKIITIDQAHITRMSRSNAATYSEVYTPIRETFAATDEARRLKLSPKHFSFNVPGGRCERCEGTGVLTVKMQLLPDVEVTCPACHGRRFNRETLSVHYRDHDISQVLDLTVEEALALFDEVPAVSSRLQVLADVGLGYLQLGQPATTFSGGEAQRVKLAKELGRRAAGGTLYLLDEPTTGLHLEDTSRLLGVLQRLVDAGNTVVVVEHNLDVVKVADWVIDLGPEGGDAGGRVLAQGTPEQISDIAASYTGQGLRKLLLSKN